MMTQPTQPSPENEEELIHTRLTLLERLKNLDDTLSWEEFFEIYWRLIYNVARKFGLPDYEAQEVVQETVISVSRNIQKFECNSKRGSFKAWLLQMTRWRILDQVRKRDKHLHSLSPKQDGAEAERRTDTVDRIADPRQQDLDAVWEEEWRSNLTTLAMQRVRQRVDPLHYQIFYLYAVKQRSVAGVCAMFDVPASRVYVIKCRISTMIRKEVRALESLPDSKPLPPIDGSAEIEATTEEGLNR